MCARRLDWVVVFSIENRSTVKQWTWNWNSLYESWKTFCVLRSAILFICVSLLDNKLSVCLNLVYSLSITRIFYYSLPAFIKVRTIVFLATSQEGVKWIIERSNILWTALVHMFRTRVALKSSCESRARKAKNDCDVQNLSTKSVRTLRKSS